MTRPRIIEPVARLAYLHRAAEGGWIKSEEYDEMVDLEREAAEIRRRNRTLGEATIEELHEELRRRASTGRDTHG
jgi:hypothetical protein